MQPFLKSDSRPDYQFLYYVNHVPGRLSFQGNSVNSNTYTRCYANICAINVYAEPCSAWRAEIRHQVTTEPTREGRERCESVKLGRFYVPPFAYTYAVSRSW
jgi:hypothetical protein